MLRKRTFFATITALLLFAVAAIPAQTQLSVASYPFDVEAANQAIGEQVQQGFIPIGLEIIEDEKIWVLYLDSGEDTGPNYSVHQFSGGEKLDAEMTTIIQRGWAPVGISRTSSNLYGLFIQQDHNIAGWRLHRSPSDSNSIQESLNQFHREGFSSVGVSVLEEQAWFLFLKSDEQLPQRVTFRGVTADEEVLRREITNAIEAGWRPAGLSDLQDGLGLLFNRPVSDR